MLGKGITVVPVAPDVLRMVVGGFDAQDVDDMKRIKCDLGYGLTLRDPQAPYLVGDLYFTGREFVTVGLKADEEDARKARRHIRSIRKSLRFLD